MLSFTYKRLPVNTNSTCILSVFKSHLEYILCYDIQGKNKTEEKTKTKTKLKANSFRDKGEKVHKMEYKNIYNI